MAVDRDSEFRAATSPHDNPGHMRQKRDHMPRGREHYFTYDQLLPEQEAADYATLSHHVDAWSLHSVPPTFSTGYHITDMSEVISDPSEGLSRTDPMSAERRAYVVERWEYWRKIAFSRYDYFIGRGRE
jgi:hypothetical protein